MASTGVLSTGQCEDAVAAEFMADRNRDHLQWALVRGVAAASGGEFVIGRQSDAELVQIMRAIYLQHACHLPDKIGEQVARLNKRVLDYAVPQIVSEVRMHRKYMRDREEAHKAVRPETVMVSKAGQRSEVQAPLRRFFTPDQ